MSNNWFLPDDQIMVLLQWMPLIPPFSSRYLLLPLLLFLTEGWKREADALPGKWWDPHSETNYMEGARIAALSGIWKAPPNPIRLTPWDGGMRELVRGTANKAVIWGFVCCEWVTPHSTQPDLFTAQPRSNADLSGLASHAATMSISTTSLCPDKTQLLFSKPP